MLAYGLLWRVTDELHLQRLAADPARRRQGLARGLLEEAIARGRATGQRCLLLEVGARNEAALALYRSVGCAIVGRRSHYYTDGDDALLLTLELVA
ncbi:MAG: GNAT family N-acetyltransferase [Proteobacteria bacterium]|nr:GNAT family N-acetyltransferase [Pseudomonadota bacterium]